MNPGERAITQELIDLLDETPVFLVLTREAMELLGDEAKDYTRRLQSWLPRAKAAVASTKALLVEQAGQGTQ